MAKGGYWEWSKCSDGWKLETPLADILVWYSGRRWYWHTDGGGWYLYAQRDELRDTSYSSREDAQEAAITQVAAWAREFADALEEESNG